MKVSEKPVKPGKLTRISELKGGHKGRVFLLENDENHKLVVKFQNEATAEALAGTRILQKVGANTPNLRGALKPDVVNILQALDALGGEELENIKSEFRKAQNCFEQVLLMPCRHTA